MLGIKERLPVISTRKGTIVDLAHIVFKKLPSYTAWVIKLEHLATEDFDPVNDLIDKGWLTTDGFPLRYSNKTIS